MSEDENRKQEIIGRWNQYLHNKHMAAEFQNADGRKKSQMVNEYIRNEIQFDKKPEAISEFNIQFAGQGPFANNSENICSPDKCYEPIERKILLLKWLQSGEELMDKNTRDDLAFKLGISSTTIKKDIEWLGYQHNILGNNVELDIRHTRNTYDHTVHPIFQTLNLKEIFFMTVILPKIVHEPYRDTALDIAGDVYRQMSDYARKHIDPYLSAEETELLRSRNQAYREEDPDEFFFYLKSGKKCTIMLKDHGEMTGIIKICNDNNFEYIINNIHFNLEDIIDGPYPVK